MHLSRACLVVRLEIKNTDLQVSWNFLTKGNLCLPPRQKTKMLQSVKWVRDKSTSNRLNNNSECRKMKTGRKGLQTWLHCPCVPFIVSHAKLMCEAVSHGYMDKRDVPFVPDTCLAARMFSKWQSLRGPGIDKGQMFPCSKSSSHAAFRAVRLLDRFLSSYTEVQ